MIKLQFFDLLPHIIKLSKFQREKYSKLWFDFAKISAGSLIIKIFEPGGPKVGFHSVITAISGLTVIWMCVRVGLHIAKEEKI